MTVEIRMAHRVEIQPDPSMNLFTNPTAEVSLAGTVSFGLSAFARQTAGGFGSPYDTSFRCYGSTGTNASWFNVEGDTGLVRHGLRAGRQYTVSGTLRIAAVQAATGAHVNARRIVVIYKNAAGTYVEIPSAQAPNAIGQTRLSVTFTLPAGFTEVFIRFFHGHVTADSVWWHSLLLTEGTSTTYFDGNSGTGFLFSQAECGWDNLRGLSTSWKADRTTNLTLPGAQFETITYDARRVPYIDATITAPLPDAATLAALDPRRPRDVILNWSLEHYTRGASGELDQLVSVLPGAYTAGTAGKLWLRRLTVDYTQSRVTLYAASGEVRMEDKHRMSGSPIDTGAADVVALWRYALTDAGEAAAEGSASAAGAVPAGDRRLWLAGESLSELYEAELAAVGARAYCDDRGMFSVSSFEQPPGSSGASRVTLPSTGPTSVIVRSVQTLNREDARDATLIRANYRDAAGVQQTAYQRFPADGKNRLGVVEEIARPIPSATYAELATARGKQRGKGYQIEAAIDLNIRPGLSVSAGAYGAGNVIRSEFRPTEGLMALEVAPDPTTWIAY